MPPQSHSVAELLNRLREGDDATATRVFHLFRHQLIALARAQLSDQLRQKVDPEDIVQSVFRSFFADAAKGPLGLEGWDNLWAWLACVTARKCRKWVDHYLAGKRSVRREVGPPADGHSAARVEAMAPDPTPEEAALEAEEAAVAAAILEDLLNSRNARDRQILVFHLQESSNQDIAAVVGVSERTVQRVLKEAREWLAKRGEQLP